MASHNTQQSDYVPTDALFPTSTCPPCGWPTAVVSVRTSRDDPKKRQGADRHAGADDQRRIRLREISDSCLVTLDELKTFLPMRPTTRSTCRPRRTAMVLDIERPAQIAAPLLGMLKRCMALHVGKGYHLVLPR
jgi:hypothetical protein